MRVFIKRIVKRIGVREHFDLSWAANASSTSDCIYVCKSKYEKNPGLGDSCSCFVVGRSAVFVARSDKSRGRGSEKGRERDRKNAVGVSEP